MATNESARFPYQHLAVLGMDKLKKYVPPTEPSRDDDGEAPASPAPDRRSSR